MCRGLADDVNPWTAREWNHTVAVQLASLDPHKRSLCIVQLRISQDAQNDIPARPQGAGRLRRTLAVRRREARD